MLHQTIIPWSPERMRRLIFSAICSSGNSANRLKPISFGIISSQFRIFFGVAQAASENAQIRSYENSVGAARQSGHHCGRTGFESGAGAASACNSLVAHVRILLQFPSAEAAEAFVSDPEYAPHAKARQGGSHSRSS